LIKDRAAFVAVVLKAMVESDPQKKANASLPEATLLDLKIDGDVAKATMSRDFIGDKPVGVEFRRIDGRWMIDTLGDFLVKESTTGAASLMNLPQPNVSPPGTKMPTAMTLPRANTNPPGVSLPDDAPQTPAAKPAAPSPPPPSSRQPRPRLHVDEAKFDFGEAESGAHVSHTFVLENLGDAPAEISKCWQSGGISLRPGSTALHIEPGEKLQLEATLDLHNQKAAMTREIIVYSNDPETPQLKLQIAGVAVPRAKVDPPKAEIGTVTGSASISKTLKVTGERGLTFQIVRTRTSGDNVKVDVKTVTPGKEYEVTATVTGPLPAGIFRGWFHLITDQRGEYATIAVALTAEGR
jgi:uncharacterized protein DUF1573